MKGTPWVLSLLCVFSFTLCGSEVYKWVDEDGVVHFSDRKPENQQSSVVEIAESPPISDIKLDQEPTESGSDDLDNGATSKLSDEERSMLQEVLSFKNIQNESELLGCWRKFSPDKSLGAKSSNIELYPFEEPESQFFCFDRGGKLYTLMINREVDWTLRKVERQAKILPSRERYSVPKVGIVSIKHLDARTETHWVTSRFVLDGNAEMLGLKTGDLLMTIRNPETGKDEYFRHLKRVE